MPPAGYRALERSERETESPEGAEPLLRSQSKISEKEEEQVVTQWLLDATDVQVFQLLGKLATARPGLIERVAALEKNLSATPKELKSVRAEQLKGDVPLGSPRADTLEAEKLPPVAREAMVPLVQFSAYVYVADEEEGVVHLDVIRLGDQSQRSSVRWQTKDGAGKAGETYEAASGSVVFEPGDGIESIAVKLLAKDTWSSILDFQVELLDDSLVNAKLAQYGSKTRVKVVDKDQFPSNELKIGNVLDLESTEAQASLPIATLVKEFCWLNFTCNPKVRQGTIKRMILDCCTNLHKLLLLFLRVYLLDKILVPDVPETSLWFIHDHQESLYIYMGALIGPFAVLYLFEYLSLGWGINGTTITWIQSAVLRRYLNYSSTAQNITDEAVVSVALNRDAQSLAKDGYGNVLRLFRELGNLAVLVVFQVTAPWVFGKPFRPTTISIVLVMPLVLFLFLYLRMDKTKKVLAEESQAEARNVSEVENAVKNFRLISDFNKRGAVVDQFEQNVRAFRAASRSVGQLIFNNRFFCKWLSELLITFWFGFGGVQVIVGELSIGLFLCDIQIFSQMEEITNQIYDIVVELQTIAPAMDRVVELLNLPTDLYERKKMQDHLREASSYLRERVQKKRKDDVRMDLLPLTLENPRICYVLRNLSEGLTSVQITCRGKIVVEQGTYVALVGQVNCGKSTRLRTLGGAVLPENLESVFIPSHLRVLHVEHEPKFFPGTLMENLCFGVAPQNPDASEQRVRLVCHLMEVQEDVMEMIAKRDVVDWNLALSNSMKQKLSLARAIIANPDVLILHRPFNGFDKRSSQKIGRVLKDFVIHRGVAQDGATFRSRRPRTCIVSCQTPYGLEVADKIYRVTKEGADEVTHDTAHETLHQEHIFRGHTMEAIGAFVPSHSLSEAFVPRG